MALLAAPALAVVTGTTDGVDTVMIESDDPADVVSMTCSGGQANVNGDPALPALDCDEVDDVVVDAADGAQTVNLGGVTQLAFPDLPRTTVDTTDGDPDSVTGSEHRDVVTADFRDTVTGGLGDDWVDGAGTASGGAGDDTLRNIGTDVDGGSGDDRIVGVGEGPIVGGAGYDVLVQDYTASPVQQAVTLFVTNTKVGPAPGFGADSTGIEQYQITTATGARNDRIDSTAFSGVLVVSTLDGDDTVRGGPGSDVVDGGGGNDTIDPGPGGDVVRGGAGNDTISVRDGVADSVDCGDGVDTVTADRSDVLTGCENVSLPPPDTGSIAGPTRVKKGKRPVFTFGSPAAGAAFECAVDDGPFKPCTSPLRIKTHKLAPGRHTLSVRAVQPAGNTDPTPSTLRFRVLKKRAGSQGHPRPASGHLDTP